MTLLSKMYDVKKELRVTSKQKYQVGTPNSL